MCSTVPTYSCLNEPKSLIFESAMNYKNSHTCISATSQPASQPAVRHGYAKCKLKITLNNSLLGLIYETAFLKTVFLLHHGYSSYCFSFECINNLRHHKIPCKVETEVLIYAYHVCLYIIYLINLFCTVG